MGNWVVVKSFSTISDATMVKNLLDLENIPSFVTGENTNQTLNYLPIYISLMIDENDYEAAIEVIRKGGYEVSEETDNLSLIINLTNKIPYLSHLSPIKRIIILVITISLLILQGINLLIKIGILN